MAFNLLNAIYGWNVEELKLYLKRRNIPCSNGNKALLQRQVHLAIQFNFVEKAQDISIEHSKSNKLILEDGLIILPDPNSLDTWEVNSAQIPRVDQSTAEQYIRLVNKDVKLSSTEPRSLSLGKSLVLSNHCGSLLYTPISPSLDYGFAKCYVIPQTNTRDAPHEAWVIVRKSDATVHRGYCSCAGGIGGSCKHVAALLYLIVNYSQSTNDVSCTSKLQIWGKPTKKHSPEFVRNIQLKKCKRTTSPEQLLNKKKRFNFDPRHVQDKLEEPIENSAFDLNELQKITGGKCALLHALNFDNACADSVCSDSNVHQEEYVVSDCVPPTLHYIAHQVKNSVNSFPEFEKQTLDMLQSHVGQWATIEETTRGQSDNQLWFDFRFCRITSSVVYEILKKTHFQTCKTLIRRIMQYDNHVTTSATRHGLRHENSACVKTMKLLLKTHRNVRMAECGFVVNGKYPYFGSSPDRIASCDCCGKFPVEVKNTFKYRDLPLHAICLKKDSCIEIIDGHTKLKRNHKFFYQCQGHILATDSKMCVFGLLASGSAEFHMEIIFRDEVIIEDMIIKSRLFFCKVLLKELYFSSELKTVICERILRDLVSDVISKAQKPQPLCTGQYMQGDQVHVADFLTAAHVEIISDFTCATCNRICVDNPQTYREKSIECSQCNCWFHMRCVGVKGNETFVKDDSEVWRCQTCSTNAFISLE